MINPWTQGRATGVPMYPPLGAWMSRRKLASAAWVPSQWIRLQLAGAHGYFYQFPRVTLAAGETQLLRVTITEDFWMVATLGASSSALAGSTGTFRLQIYEDESAYKHSKYGINEENATSDATEPALNMFPHFIKNGSPVNCRVQNLDGANPNTVDVCLFGYSGWWRDINQRPE
jgi:hypothetical protein